MRVITYNTELRNRTTVLVKESGINYPVDSSQLDSPKKIVALMNDVFRLDKKAEEYIYMLAFDTKCKLLGVFELSHGTVNSSIVSPREIFIRALLAGASCIVLIHNHPSGDISPSPEDINVTKRVKVSGEVIGIPLIEHIIIGNGYLSFMENGLFE